MTPLDPDAAAAAYIDSLPEPARLAAVAATDVSHWLWAGDLVLFILVCWLILRTGLLARIEAGVSQGRPRPWLASAACAAGFTVLVSALLLPWVVYGAWLSDSLHHFPVPPLTTYIVMAVKGDELRVVLATVLVPLLYALIRRAPGRWWIGGGAAFLLLSIVVMWAPYALDAGPASLPTAPPGAAREGLLRLVRDTGLPATEIYVSANPLIDADVTGTPMSSRVVVSHGMWTEATPAQMRASVGHLIGHWRNGDQLTLGVVMGVLGALVFLVAGRLYTPVARRLGARAPADVRDPAGLPILAAVACLCLFVAKPCNDTVDRLVNVRADQYSLDHAAEPDGLAQSLVRDWRGDKLDPSPLEEAIFYDHPSLASRLRHAMSWKAAHPAAPAASR